MQHYSVMSGRITGMQIGALSKRCTITFHLAGNIKLRSMAKKQADSLHDEAATLFTKDYRACRWRGVHSLQHLDTYNSWPEWRLADYEDDRLTQQVTVQRDLDRLKSAHR